MSNPVFDISDFRRRLSTQVLGRQHEYLPSVTSTQDLARARAEMGAAEGLAVIAGEQTMGRGRGGRTWWSPPTGGLYVSLLLRPRLQTRALSWITMCLALGVVEGVEDVCSLRPDLKWPNDVELQGRKLAGILAEGALQGGSLQYAVVGAGINVNLDFSSQPGLGVTATSLQTVLGRAVALEPLLATVLGRTEQHYLAMKAGISPVPAWQRRLVTLGRQVEAQLADGRRLQGSAEAVLEDGALRVRLDDGQAEVLHAGDVSLRALNSDAPTQDAAPRL